MNWENPYIRRALIRTDYILPCVGNRLSPAERELFETKRAKFHRVFCEPCSGSGKFLIESAEQARDTLFIGFELRYKRAARTAEKAHQHGLNNLMVIRHDASVMAELFPPASLAGVAVNFPDPWDKRRWQKNRLLSAPFLNNIATLLVDQGTFTYKPDHAGRFNEVLEVLRDIGLFETVRLSRDLHKSIFADENIFTDFELLFRSQSLPIHYVMAQKRPVSLLAVNDV
jgi:tRNA (guanine-N7-)-methyltransferase